MAELVTRNYWWLGVTRDMARYVEGCDMCQWMKNRTEEIAGKLKLSEVLRKLWTHITLDFITKLLIVARCNERCRKIYKRMRLVSNNEE